MLFSEIEWSHGSIRLAVQQNRWTHLYCANKTNSVKRLWRIEIRQCFLSKSRVRNDRSPMQTLAWLNIILKSIFFLNHWIANIVCSLPLQKYQIFPGHFSIKQRDCDCYLHRHYKKTHKITLAVLWCNNKSAWI